MRHVNRQALSVAIECTIPYSIKSVFAHDVKGALRGH